MGFTIAPAFAAKKSKILADLALPDDQYTDASPKGSVDAGVRKLIDIVNGLEGAVTTSSCAGRISIFKEGRKSRDSSTVTNEAESNADDSTLQSAVPGGKGLGGQWLFVSHEPVQVDRNMTMETLCESSCFEFGDVPTAVDPATCRLVKLAFEPMILHIMTASLQHARPILAAALDAGFRESGLQSLKCLDDSNAFPMVAIRTAGLALSSVIGFIHEGLKGGDDKICPLVDDNYLRVLIELDNERFKANTDRIKRLGEELKRIGANERESHSKAWEDKATRAERKRAEGLREQARQRGRATSKQSDGFESSTDIIVPLQSLNRSIEDDPPQVRASVSS